MREKLVRTEEGEKARLRFARDHGKKPASCWVNCVHAYLDNKHIPVYLMGAARAYAARRAARGSFRAPGQGLGKGHVKPRKGLKAGFGKGLQVAVAIYFRRVL